MLRFLSAAMVVVQAGFGMAIIPRASLTRAALAAFDEHVRRREQSFEQRNAGGAFLWSGKRTGMIVEPLSGDGTISVENGLIHDWLGAIFLPGATLDRVLALVQNYDQHKVNYAPEVVDSKLLRRDGDFFKVRLRLRKHKVITVVLDTEYDVTYRRLSATRAVSRSYSTRIAEIENPGGPSERALPPGQDHGFLWRLDSFWRFEEHDGGVTMEMEAISLTRDVPRLVSPIVMPIVRQLPRESLERTLENTRRALGGR